MWNWLSRQFRRTETQTMPLKFVMDRTNDGYHVVQIYKQSDDRDEILTNLNDLWQYGYQERMETERKVTIFRLAEQDRQTLLGLRSLNPQIDGDGRLRFPFAPPMLNYLRNKDNLDETETSAKLRISQTAPQAVAQIDYTPGGGLTIEMGYQVEDRQEIIRPESQQHTSDGNYLLVDDTFVPVPKSQNTAVQEWLKWPKRTILREDIPEFFQRDLVLLKKEFTAVLTDLAAQIRIVQTPLTPVIKIDTSERGWLDFDVSYQAGEFTLPHSLLTERKDEPFIPLDDFT